MKKKWKQHTRSIGSYKVCQAIHNSGSWRRRKKNKTKNIFEEIMTEHFPNLKQETDNQVQEHRGSQTRWTQTDPHWDVKVKLLSHVRLSATPRTTQSVEFSRPEYRNEQPFPSPGDLPDPGIESGSPALQVDSLPAESQGKPKNTGVGSLPLLQWIVPTQESNQGLLRCRQILYQLSYQDALKYSIVKMERVKERILKAAREKQRVIYKGTPQ